MATKILVSGDVEGNFAALFARVGKVHASKAGPFHALLCVGSFFGRKGAQELTEFIQGTKEVPLPTYFICGDEFGDTSLIDSLPSGGTLCPNLHYLGRAGLQTLQLGADGRQTLSVAYLSGVYDPSSYFGSGGGSARAEKYQPNYTEEDAIAAISAGIGTQSIDVLLTAEWAKGWQMMLHADKMPKTGAATSAMQGSPVVAKIASQLPARYHFAGMQDTYFELPPYQNRLYVTRFFGLGKFPSEKQQKNLYACNVSPFASLDKTTLPADVTPCPYTVGTRPPVSAVAASASSSSSHPFPSSEQSSKRQRLDPSSSSGSVVPAAAANDRFSPGFLQSMSQYDAASAASGGALRWDFKKPQRGPPPTSYVCRRCSEPGHWIDECPTRAPARDGEGGGESRPPPGDYVCRKCNQPGHYIRECPLILAEESERVPPEGYRCKKCDQPGHFLRSCPLVVAENEARAAIAASSGVHASRIPPASYICAKCSKPGHWIVHCPAAETKQPPPHYVCKVCNIAGHWIKDCPVVAKENAERQNGIRRPPADYVCLICNNPGHYIQDCPQKTGPSSTPGTADGLDANGMPAGTKQDCWFCLATEHVSTHLILSVGVENYLALAKGGLTDDHVLILPIVHVSSSLDLTPEQRVEVDRYKLALRKYYRSRGMECVMYERFIPTRAAQHMHIQIVPLTRSQALTARSTLLTEATKLSEHLTFVEIPREHTLAQANPSKSPFVLFEVPELPLPDEAVAASSSSSSSAATAADSFRISRLIHYVNPRINKVFGLFDFPRNVVASMIGQPERGDWKKCATGEAEETELVEKMKPLFAPFDFTLEEEEQPAEPAPAAAAAASAATMAQ